MTTPYWSDFVPYTTVYRIVRGFHRTFATGVACRQGTLTPPDTWSRPFWTCIYSTCWDQSFFRNCRYFSGLCSSNIPQYFLDFALNITTHTCPKWDRIKWAIWNEKRTINLNENISLTGLEPTADTPWKVIQRTRYQDEFLFLQYPDSWIQMEMWQYMYEVRYGLIGKAKFCKQLLW